MNTILTTFREFSGSGVDSITGEHNVSGRSSAYGEQDGLLVGGSTVGSSVIVGGARSENSSIGAPTNFQVFRRTICALDVV